MKTFLSMFLGASIAAGGLVAWYYSVIRPRELANQAFGIQLYKEELERNESKKLTKVAEFKGVPIFRDAAGNMLRLYIDEQTHQWGLSPLMMPWEEINSEPVASKPFNADEFLKAQN